MLMTNGLHNLLQRNSHTLIDDLIGDKSPSRRHPDLAGVLVGHHPARDHDAVRTPLRLPGLERVDLVAAAEAVPERTRCLRWLA